MAGVSGRRGYFAFAGRNYSGDARNIDFPFGVDPIDTTTFGDNGYATNIQGILKLPITVDAFWSASTAVTDLDAALFARLPSGGTAPGTALWAYMPDGSATGRILYQGNANLTSYKITQPVEGAIAASFAVENSGSITRSIAA